MSANLALIDTDTVIQLSSVGESAFGFPFPFLADDEVKVSVDQVEQALGADYTLSGIGEAAGGTVTFLSPTSNGELISIWLDMPIKRVTGFSTGAAVLFGQDLNTEFARQVRHDQMIRRDTRRALRIAIDDVQSGQEMVIPSKLLRAGNVLGFDGSGNPTMVALGVSGDASLRTDLASQVAAFGNELVVIRRTDLEEENGVTPVSDHFLPGDVFRMMSNAQIADVLSGDLTLDVTVAVNNAIKSGHTPFATGGNLGIADTIIVAADQNFQLFNAVTVDRIGSSTEPLIHMYGGAMSLNGSGQTRIRSEANDSPHGLILVGPNPTDVGGTSDVSTRGFTIQGVKVMGAVGTVENSSPGIYLHSGARRLGGNTSVCYKGVLLNIEIRNCPVGLEFSTDANSHYISGMYITRWLEAALWFNAAYGNVINGIMMEFAEIALTPNNDKRYAIEFNKQNSGSETGTDSGYFAAAALDNSISGYAELTNGTGGNVNRNISLLRQNEDSGLYGRNNVHIMGTLSGGIGLLGSSTAETDIGTTNTIETVNGYIFNRGRWRVHGHNIKQLVDGSGSINFKESTCRFESHNTDVTGDATQETLFVWDNILDAGRVPVRIEVTYDCKVDGQLPTQSGKMVWAARLFSNSSFDFVKVQDDPGILPKGAAKSLTMNLVLAAGTAANSMKATIGFLSAGASGTKWAVGFSVKLLTSSVSGSKVDWDDDLEINP